ncbi:MAG TPA: ABC transporter substrate-binding protein [Pseudolabrys sp.]|nr:ABC transporter substrate-binding protein [Pseudolabrys sp.]
MTLTKFWLSAALVTALAIPAQAKTIEIGIGHQSMCTDTYSAGIVIKELKLLEKHLPHTGKYAGVDYDIKWSDYSSGGPITNQMLANKLAIGVMGDYPLIVNGAKFQATNSLRSLYVAGTGYNLKGSGNGIVVPVSSNIYSIEDLKGKSISTPVGSASWGMLLKAMQDAKIPTSGYEMKNQAPAVGAANIAASKIDAHADFCPWSELMEFRGTGRKIYDGSQTGVPYLHGVVVREDFAKEYPEVVVAFIEAVYDAGQWIKADPMHAVEMMEKWTGVEKEVLYLYFSKGGLLTLDPTIKPQWIDALKFDHTVLAKEQQIPPLDFKAWITEDYVKTAYKALGVDYAKQQAQIVDPKIYAGYPMEIWHARDGIKTYTAMADFLKAVAKYNAEGAKLNATYVYDKDTGLKIFGKSAFYVKGKDGSYSPFLLKPDAAAYAKTVGGTVVSFDQAWGAFQS